jgi:hypothetical protein
MNVKEREVDWLQKIKDDIHPRLTEDQQRGLKIFFKEKALCKHHSEASQ